MMRQLARQENVKMIFLFKLSLKTRSSSQLRVLKRLFHFLQVSLFHSPHRSFLLIPPSSSSSLIPPRPLFLLAPYSSLSLIPPSSLFLLTPCPSFILVQHCLNHLESVKVDFSSILTKASRTEGRTDGPTYRRTCPLIEMQTLIKRIILNKRKQINFTF